MMRLRNGNWYYPEWFVGVTPTPEPIAVAGRSDAAELTLEQVKAIFPAGLPEGWLIELLPDDD